jgi:hypothetical protein
MESGNLTEVKAALELYLAQYDATDKLWAYFSSVTLAVIGFSIASEKASRSFLEASIVAAGYLLFCFGNFQALFLSQKQLLQFAELARTISDKHKVTMNHLTPFAPENVARFYWFVAAAVVLSVLVITWRRRRYGAPIDAQ